MTTERDCRIGQRLGLLPKGQGRELSAKPGRTREAVLGQIGEGKLFIHGLQDGEVCGAAKNVADCFVMKTARRATLGTVKRLGCWTLISKSSGGY